MSRMANIVHVYCVHDDSFYYFKTLMDCVIANIKCNESVTVTPGPR